jgi:hypothetical protein
MLDNGIITMREGHPIDEHFSMSGKLMGFVQRIKNSESFDTTIEDRPSRFRRDPSDEHNESNIVCTPNARRDRELAMT